MDDCERLLPDLEPVPLPPGRVVHGAGDRQRHAYFLTAGIVPRLCVMEGAESEEFAVTGSEGLIGAALFLGGESTPSRAVVLSAGYAYRLGADVLHREFDHDGLLPRLLLDRARLEARACECYAGVRQAYDELLRAEKIIGNARVDDNTRRHGGTRFEEPTHARLT